MKILSRCPGCDLEYLLFPKLRTKCVYSTTHVKLRQDVLLNLAGIVPRIWKKKKREGVPTAGYRRERKVYQGKE